ncbi:MAG TPA: hypothetical protein VME86_11030 [Acidobacteriaceae bacterium]|nr:hypothetical protein [Acidobacteriaceae bacterium]
MSPTYYIVFTAVTAAAVLLQALVLLAIYIAIRRVSGAVNEALGEVKTKALPVIESAQNLLNDVSPKLKITTTNLTEVSETLRKQAGHVNATIESLLGKTNLQINRVDEMVGGTLDVLGQVFKAIDSAFSLPARRVSGIMHGFRVGMEVLLSSKKSRDPEAAKNESAGAEPAPPETPATAEQKPA